MLSRGKHIHCLCSMQQLMCKSVVKNKVNPGVLVPKCFASIQNVKDPKALAEQQSQDSVGKYLKTEPLPKLTEPIAKNFFLGKLDPKHLEYPQISKEELEQLNELIAPIEKFFANVDSKSIDVNAKIPDEVLQQLKDLGLFGLQIPEKYGGLNLNATSYARVGEVTSKDGSIAVTLAAHQAIGLKGILIAGSEEQKEKYLPKLASGEHVAAFCLTEPSSGSDAASIQTKATLSEDGRTWLLNGSKIWISNGGIADIFTVFAKTPVKSPEGEIKEKVTAFIVERSFGGVTNGKPEDKLGIRGSNTCEVFFDNTPVPPENVIGEVGSGFKLAMRILNSGRFSMGSSGAGVLKYLINLTAQHANTRAQFGQKLAKFGLVQEKFAKMAVTAYAMESMAYLTSNVLDQYDDPDLSMEAAMVKIFSSEGCWTCVSECLQVMGGLGYMKDYPFERYLRDARIMQIFEGTNEILRLFVALNGVQFAGKSLKDLIKKLRDPFNNPGLLFKTSWRKSRGKSTLASTVYLHGDVHPLLEREAKLLESGLTALGETTESLLTQYGNKIIDEQMKLGRLADIAIDLYAMTSCIGRASRSVCIGLRNSDLEVLLTRSFCYTADQRINKNIKELNSAKADKLEIDDTNRQIAEAIFKVGGYAAEHPLNRNY
ncbi:complex I assembly factor ACAD9, mitochondrial-like [Physella acuta]|uniref:complex I assembly factor ACAD9, mitochondrial-like n=1 Tax=Physella acuta TaxID=109671 RepID=UPI0027DD8CA8|nr:complex I assembly factor ACAD9, mitochondrial-like [Physella acuta]XP_059143104.1 complex I assembly factor ACAD9, mitochondrial-like [Physella acuta]XP_059143105.1 complex I assembly factor ACAD9, mitochondrial-like [Physella acuta]XP_059143107.1 complex I assembly factor ACAD9, mitochondrial-like [Physella acuta]XP_059143108.1 complex I assembly factor ACAD9, mitochondrial-like [Physella acuta]XP_059143109.1 complex I assembly factor ACAD9, mitochondrial-like [Physella acuta]